MSFLSRAFGKKVKERRIELNLTQEDLAEKVGTKPATISRWENGEFLPGEENLNELGRILGLTENDVFVQSKSPQDLAKEAAQLAANDVFAQFQSPQDIARNAAQLAVETVLKAGSTDTKDPKKIEMMNLIGRLSPRMFDHVLGLIRDIVNSSVDNREVSRRRVR